MMWLLSHFTSRRSPRFGFVEIGQLFESSPSWARTLIREVETKICEDANVERHNPTLAATRRLQAVGALPGRFERGAFELGEEPPESWPVTRSKEKP
jgi:hypothetical protein